VGDLFSPKIVTIYGRRSWFMAKRKTGFVTGWVDDTPALGPNDDAGQRPSLIREDTSTFLRDVLHLLTWMDIFLNWFVFAVAAGQGLGRAQDTLG
jgi:hypothetical protein